MPESILGQNALIKFYKVDDFYDFACATELSIDFTKETKSVKTIGDGNWNRKRAAKNGCIITASGLVQFDTDPKMDVFDVLDAFMQDTDVVFRIIFEDVSNGNLRVIGGIALPTNVNLSGGAEGFANGSLILEVNGKPVIRDTLEVCDLEVTAFGATLIAPGEGGVNHYSMAVTHTGTSTLLRYEYSIDGAARLLGGLTSPFNFFATSGSHSFEIWPICENGNDGISFSQDLTLS